MKLPVLFKKGAEASLYLATWHRRKVIMKKRLPKSYRPARLDEKIRSFRTIHEPQLMHEAKKAGVPTPTIFLVDTRNCTIIMEYVKGKQIKQILNAVAENKRKSICFEIGRLVGKLHGYGLVHGDLTTSNMILNPNGRIFFLDFGLGDRSSELEAMGVDLHLMKTALRSTHFVFVDECFDSMMKGYTSIRGVEASESVLGKIKEIERRGRYVAERREKND